MGRICGLVISLVFKDYVPIDYYVHSYTHSWKTVFLEMRLSEDQGLTCACKRTTATAEETSREALLSNETTKPPGKGNF